MSMLNTIVSYLEDINKDMKINRYTMDNLILYSGEYLSLNGKYRHTSSYLSKQDARRAMLDCIKVETLTLLESAGEDTDESVETLDDAVYSIIPLSDLMKPEAALVAIK